MLTDPQVITVATVAKSMPKTSTSGTSSVYEMPDLEYTLTISHQITNKRRIRSLLRFDHRKVVTNPVDSSTDYDNSSIQIILDHPEFGFTSTDVANDWAGLKAWLDSTVMAKLFGRES
jgi:hypothetical protein